MTRKSFFLLILFTTFITAGAQKKALKTISRDDLKTFMSFFASDELAGRETGTSMNDTAASYIRTRILNLGLKPAPGYSDYYQTIPLVSSRLDKEGTGLEIINSQGKTSYITDSLLVLARPSADIEFTGEVVFAGFGYEDKSTGYDDLNGLDLKDKIVLLMTRNPVARSAEDAAFFDEKVEGPKIMSIISRGAKVVLLVYDPAHKFRDVYSSGLAQMIPSDVVGFRDQNQTPMPAQLSFVTRYTADQLLKSAGRDLKQMFDEITSTGNPASCGIPDITVKVKTSLESTDFSGVNVIGVVEGADPVLRDECIVYTAHFDHVGVGDNGKVYNGADDNASGSMVLLEVADAFMKLKKKPLRTIIFAWVNGEEKGLLGSRYYVSNPPVPMQKTLANINLDMVGRSKMPADTGKFYGYELDVTEPGQIYVYSRGESSELLDIMYSSARKSGLKVVNRGSELEFGSSDHVPFRDNGVPSLMFHSGIHTDLHGDGDDTEKIDFNKMEQVSKMVFLIGYKTANQRNRIVVNNPSGE